MEYVGR